MSKEETPITLAALQLLQGAIAEGVRRVKYDNKEVEYRSLDEMFATEKWLRDKLGLTVKCGSSGLFGGRRLKTIHSKGLDDSEC